jgi:glycerate 2-kinase
MRILVAPNAFKNSLDAKKVAQAIREGLIQSKLACEVECFPVGDGGDGTAPLLIEREKGKRLKAEVLDPLGRKITASFGLIDDGKTAVLELADAVGLRLLKQKEYAPLHANTRGAGELIKKALEQGVRKIIMCIGGSATVDGASGMLMALGAKFIDQQEKGITQMPEALDQLKRIDLTGIDIRLSNTELVVLCDVDNPLLGTNGAASIFGPQKGASPKEVIVLDKLLTHFRNVVKEQTGKDMASIKYGGAAGGVAAGMHCLLGAKLMNGIDYFLGITGFEDALKNTDLVITGEGSLDEQTLMGKAPYGVAKRAKEKSLPVIGMAGNVPIKISEQLSTYFDVLMPINNQIMDLETAIAHTNDNLVRTAKALGDLLSK